MQANIDIKNLGFDELKVDETLGLASTVHAHKEYCIIKNDTV